MKRELIWNSCLIIFAIFIVFVFTMSTTASTALMPGFSNSLFSPFGLENKIELGLIIGAILIVFRYINLAILSIANKDLRLLVLLLSYSIPIFFVLFGIQLFMESKMDALDEQFFPVPLIETEIGELRTAGMFKSYPDKSNKFITELAIGRAIFRTRGMAYSSQYWDVETNSINTLELLRLDTDKVWKGEDTEFILEGNHAYEEAIKELGNISEEHFKPTEIKEDWESREVISLTFKMEDKEYKFQPLVRNDWADMTGVVEFINQEVLSEADYQFYYGQGGDIMVIGLTNKEREELTKMTGIEFQEVKSR